MAKKGKYFITKPHERDEFMIEVWSVDPRNGGRFALWTMLPRDFFCDVCSHNFYERLQQGEQLKLTLAEVEDDEDEKARLPCAGGVPASSPTAGGDASRGPVAKLVW